MIKSEMYFYNFVSNEKLCFKFKHLACSFGNQQALEIGILIDCEEFIAMFLSHASEEKKTRLGRLSLRISKQKVTTWVPGSGILGISEQSTMNSVLSTTIYMKCFVI